MSLETSTESRQARRDSGPKLRLKQGAFDTATEAIGHESEIARARFLGVTDRTLRRARLGTIGHEFITKTLVAMKPHARKLAKHGMTPTFEAFFEVQA